jgi:uncharacterized membrane protein YphA (DoxX/SURF4 family)
MKYLPAITRVLLGLSFLVFGLNGFFLFMPPPPTGIPQGAMDFSVAMTKTGYFSQLVAGTEVACGALLLVGRFVPLALTVLAPVLLNIVLFHAFLFPSAIAIPLVFTVAELYLAWCYRSAFKPVLAARARPV